MISPKKLLRISTAVSAVALTLFVAAAPAYAMQDIAIDDSSRSFATAVEGAQGAGDSMPDNPNAALPDTVSERIPDDSTVVSEKLAVTPEGEVRDIETGKAVTDETLVGTQDQQPDPLAKTDGESFIPVSASDVKDAVEQSVKQSVEQSSSKNGATVKLAKFDGNDYGAHWGTYNNTKAFFDYRNNLFVQQAKGVIDVSSWQGDIDWAKAKADGVDITCETGPHYLVFCDEDLQEDGRFKMNPPLRSREDMKALIGGIVDGTIDMIATDHAPHSAEEKGRGLEKSAMGVVGLETSFAACYTYLVKTGIITLEKLVELMSTAPRARFGLPAGNDFTVWDLDAEFIVDPADFLSMGKATPFTGTNLCGKCVLTVHNGKIVYIDKGALR